MSKRVDLLLDFLSQDSSEFTNDPANGVDIKRRVEDDTVKEVTYLNMELAVSPATEVIPLPDSAAQYLIIVSDQDLKATINGAAAPIQLLTQIAGTKAPVFYTRGTITSLTLGNDSTTTIANVDVILARF